MVRVRVWVRVRVKVRIRVRVSVKVRVSFSVWGRCTMQSTRTFTEFRPPESNCPFL